MNQLVKNVRLLENTDFFGEIDKNDLSVIAGFLDMKTFKPGEAILKEKEPVDGVYVVEDGYVNVSINRQVVRINIPPGEMFGEMSCLSSKAVPASASVIAVNNVKALFIPREKVKELANRFPVIWERAWEKLSLRLSYTSNRFSEMLDHTQLIRLDKNGVISGEMSAICARIIGMEQSELENRKFSEVMFQNHDNPEDKTDWESIYPMLFEGMSIQAVIELLPKTVRFVRSDGYEIFLEFKYLPCLNQHGEIEMVHVNIEDATVKRRLEMKTNRLETEKLVRDKMYDEPDGYIRFLNLAESVLNDLSGPSAMSILAKNDILKSLHTVKGLAGLFMLNEMKEAAHVLEEAIIEDRCLTDQDNDGKCILKNYEEQCHYAGSLFENMSSELKRRLTGVVISEALITEIRNAIKAGELALVKRLVGKIGSIPVEKIVFGWEDLIDKMSEQMEKFILFEKNIEEGLVISRKSNEVLSQAMIHLVRNAASHGIESEEEREAAGKTEDPTIVFSARSHDGKVYLTVADNGKGIDNDVICKKALEKADKGKIDKNLVQRHIDEGRIPELIFIPGFSTVETANDISGRGVGMDAVKEAVEKLGGMIRVESRKGEGAAFIIILSESLL